LGCNKSFCAAYWQTQDVKPDSIHTMCNGESFKPIYQRTISMIPDSTHQNNRYEQAITKKCIEHSGKSVQAVISDWIVKFGKREIDRTKLPLSQAEIISPQSHLCNDCYSKLVGFLLYWFRVSMPKSDIPLEASDRQDCWYGHACRTQHHNLDHAEKRNHVCRPTRGNPNTPLTS
ncbi:E3 ubiquitin-protein ligase CHFR, partial [Zostera marina]